MMKGPETAWGALRWRNGARVFARAFAATVWAANYFSLVLTKKKKPRLPADE